MHGNTIEYRPNQKINNLTYIKEAELHISPSGRRYRKALFLCHCGNKFVTHVPNVKNKSTISCGCLKPVLKSHKLSHHPLYATWCSMKARCYSKKGKSYKWYGSRGIKVCDEWKDDIGLFVTWCEANGYKKGLQIDRINNDGNYEPNNCRWVTPVKNSCNRRSTKLNWDLVNEIRNTKLLIPDIAQRELSEAYGVTVMHIYYILNNKTWIK